MAYGTDVDAIGGWLGDIEDLWRDQSDGVHREAATMTDGVAILPMTIHPDVSGRPQTLLVHERLVAHFRSHENARFVRSDEIAADFRRRCRRLVGPGDRPVRR